MTLFFEIGATLISFAWICFLTVRTSWDIGGALATFILWIIWLSVFGTLWALQVITWIVPMISPVFGR